MPICFFWCYCNLQMKVFSKFDKYLPGQVYVEIFVAVFPTTFTSFSYSRIHPSGNNLEWLLCMAINTHLPIKLKR